MEENLWVTIVLACLGSSGFFAVVQMLLGRVFKKNDDRDELTQVIKSLKEDIREIQRDCKRQQLLTVMYHNPTNVDTILEIARVYFLELGGNWYVESEFQKWAKAQNVDLPRWFRDFARK